MSYKMLIGMQSQIVLQKAGDQTQLFKESFLDLVVYHSMIRDIFTFKFFPVKQKSFAFPEE